MHSRFAVTGLLIFCAAHSASAVPKLDYTVEEKVPVPMRDGVKLAAKIYRPKAPGKYPTLLCRRYWQTGDEEAEHFVELGYAVALVDSRGRGASEGVWRLYESEPEDGYDTQQWLGQQPWSTGRIGGFGQSYNAFTQLMPAPLGSKYMKCLFPIEGQQTCFGHIYNDGVMQLNMVYSSGLHVTGPTAIGPYFRFDDPHWKQLPLLAVVDKYPKAAYIKEWFKHEKWDDYWRSYGIAGKYDRITAPSYFVTGWYDNLIHENWKNFLGFTQQGSSPECRRGSKILVGPWTHGSAGQQYELRERWYDYWLKGVNTGIDREPPIRIYVMGANKWRPEYEWPLKRTKYVSYHLASGGHANSSAGDGRLITKVPAAESKTDTYKYDPLNPVYTLGGQVSSNPELWGAKDRSSTQKRKDVLVYTTEPLEQDTEVTGPVKVKLFAASSAKDTDWTATLSDVYPDGKAIHICEGIRGAKFHESLEHPSLIEPGKIYEYEISLWETSNVFKKGHRIQLEIASSNFPRYVRNQNTGLPLGTSAETKIAEQTIYHDAEHPSQLILPIIPAKSSSDFSMAPQKSDAREVKPIPKWVTYPGKEWKRITPEQAGFDVEKLDAVIAKAKIQGGGWGGSKVADDQWGAVLTRGGYMVKTWGDATFKCQSASLGKCLTRALVGISVERGVIRLNEPIWKTWTGRGELSNPHKHLDAGHHTNLTWRQLVEHRGGFVLESGYHWRTRSELHKDVPDWADWTAWPNYDNYAHAEPGKRTWYSSGGYWRLGQALTAAWNKDLKQVLDEELFSKMDLPADRWDWTPGKTVHDTLDWYPDYPGYGDYVDRPYTVKGHVVRGTPGWVVMSAQDLARFGLLVACRGRWKGRQLVDPKYLSGHAGLDVHVVGGDPETYVAIGKLNTKNFPFGTEIVTGSPMHFPQELIAGPVQGAAQ